jgi:hypothetical protein
MDKLEKNLPAASERVLGYDRVLYPEQKLAPKPAKARHGLFYSDLAYLHKL